MNIRPEVIPSLVVALLIGGVIIAVSLGAGLRKARAWVPGLAVALILSGYLLFFFRDPPRTPPTNPNIAVAGADGRVAAIKRLKPEEFQKVASFCGLNEKNMGRFAGVDVVRVSIFLSLFDVHVNRAPMAGKSFFLGYFPGKHIFTFKEKSSDYNQHNSILITNKTTCCLVNQIVGPIARRVVYWPDHNQPVTVKTGDSFGMMKFGSRLDMYFPDGDVTVTAKVGDVVRAGETMVAGIKVAEESP
jgi:phosphatidylserine decarboxylase